MLPVYAVRCFKRIRYTIEYFVVEHVKKVKTKIGKKLDKNTKTRKRVRLMKNFMKHFILTIATILTGLVVIYGVSVLVKKTASTPFWKQPAPPEVGTLPEAIYSLEKMYDAIAFEESCYGLLIYGKNGEIGDYQLKKIYVDDVNRIQRLLGYDGEEPWMSYNDRFDTVKSRRATAIVTSHYANATWKDKPHTAKQYIETAARAHHRPADRNNSKTDAYWAKVKAVMEGRK
jgi:hypothetical protein